MSANLFGQRFYGHRLPAWHALGITSDTDMTAVEALTALGGGYWFEKRPVEVELNGVSQEIGDYAIVRSGVPDDPQEQCFGFVKKGYNIIQPLTVCELFDKNVNLPVETLGMLGKGEKVFCTWRLPSFDIKGDEVNMYGFIAVGYDAKTGASLNVVSTRVVCQNTWSQAVSEVNNSKDKTRGKTWVGRHNSKNIERDLGYWLEYVQARAESEALKVKGIYLDMSNRKIENGKLAYQLLTSVYPDTAPLPDYFPEQLRAEKQSHIDARNEGARLDRLAVLELFDGAGTGIDATGWGLFNAVTEYENWGRDSKKAVENSIMLGARSNVITRAANVIQTV